MRLTATQQQTIREASLRCFGVPPRLFGSRVDDAQRGGDIDIYIESDLPAADAFERQLQMAAELYRRLGDRKVDIVVNTGAVDLPIYRVAQAQGVWL
jgi:predicted nucleotidyltransferase